MWIDLVKTEELTQEESCHKRAAGASRKKERSTSTSYSNVSLSAAGIRVDPLLEQIDDLCFSNLDFCVDHPRYKDI